MACSSLDVVSRYLSSLRTVFFYFSLITFLNIHFYTTYVDLVWILSRASDKIRRYLKQRTTFAFCGRPRRTNQYSRRRLVHLRPCYPAMASRRVPTKSYESSLSSRRRSSLRSAACLHTILVKQRRWKALLTFGMGNTDKRRVNENCDILEGNATVRKQKKKKKIGPSFRVNSFRIDRHFSENLQAWRLHLPICRFRWNIIVFYRFPGRKRKSRRRV